MNVCDIHYAHCREGPFCIPQRYARSWWHFAASPEMHLWVRSSIPRPNNGFNKTDAPKCHFSRKNIQISLPALLLAEPQEIGHVLVNWINTYIIPVMKNGMLTVVWVVCGNRTIPATAAGTGKGGRSSWDKKLGCERRTNQTGLRISYPYEREGKAKCFLGQDPTWSLVTEADGELKLKSFFVDNQCYLIRRRHRERGQIK
jgi:hypothetical protein